jgi:hypothetical protein
MNFMRAQAFMIVTNYREATIQQTTVPTFLIIKILKHYFLSF